MYLVPQSELEREREREELNDIIEDLELKLEIRSLKNNNNLESEKMRDSEKVLGLREILRIKFEKS